MNKYIILLFSLLLLLWWCSNNKKDWEMWWVYNCKVNIHHQWETALLKMIAQTNDRVIFIHPNIGTIMSFYKHRFRDYCTVYIDSQEIESLVIMTWYNHLSWAIKNLINKDY